MNYCDSGGWVVDRRPIPSDPTEYDLGKLPKRGCNHIRCSVCKALVRSVAGITLRTPGAKHDLKQLYATADLASSPSFASSSTYRFYLCECSFHEEAAEHPLEEPNAEWAIAVAGQWHCDGHPVAQLPRDFDGVAMRADTVGEIAAKAVRGWVPADARAEDKPRAYWVARLYARLAQTPFADNVVRAVSSALDDPDPITRTRAVHFFMHLPMPSGAARAYEVLAGDRRLFAGVHDEMTPIKQDATLEDSLWRVAAPLVKEGTARELARREALTEGKGSRALYEALAAGDRAWIEESAADIVRATPARAKDLLEACKVGFAGDPAAKAALAKIRALVG